MPWQPEDWNDWPEIDRVTRHGAATHVRAVLDILHRLPDLENKTLLELTRGVGSSLHEAAASLDLAARRIGSRVSPATCDVIMALDTIESDDADALFAEVHTALVEGGVFLATLAARPRGSSTFALPIREPAAGFHEVELQFRLTRAAFQGIRLRRLRGPAHEPARILCMAVRRALN